MHLSKGRLLVVATPIGNLEDITLRALRIIAEADLILCEDTRHSGKLLKAYDLKKPLLSLHKFNEQSRVSRILSEMKTGKRIVLMSDAGSPTISDPGARLVRVIWESGFRVECIPGVCAATAALSVSGFSGDRFHFAGFLPVKSGGRARQLKGLCALSSTIIFYESPHRILRLIKELSDHFPDRELAICRELTKKFEEIVRGSPNELLEKLQMKKPKGEYVVLVNAI